MWFGQVRGAAFGTPHTSLFAFLRTHIVLFTAAPTERERMILATFPI